jgi:membrane protease YdiL (CAAX protease family)
MGLKSVFINRHNELRVGWRIVVFLLVCGVFLVIASAPRFLGFNLAFVNQLLFILALFGATFLVVRFVNKKPFGAIGLSLHHRALKELVQGLLIGFLMMAVIFVVLQVLGYVTIELKQVSFWPAVWAMLSLFWLFTVGAVAEELLYRGYVFQTLIQGITFLPTLLIMSALFAISHGMNPNTSTLAFVNIGLAGVWLGFAYMKTRGLWFPIGLHFSWNFAQTGIFGFNTSGLEFADSRLVVARVTGPEWLTGGAFGPEGGALASVVIIAGTGYFLKSTAIAAPEGVITLDSLEDLIPTAVEAPGPEEGAS